MDDREIFKYLFEICKKSKDPEGVVAACLVKKGKILVSSPSADDGIRHAEDLLLSKAKVKGIPIERDLVLYTTLEPCSFRSPENKIEDCTTLILRAGIKNVVFAAQDPEYSLGAEKRFKEAKVSCRMIGDREIIRKAVAIFNSTIKIPLASMQLPRVKKI
jgi:pyrimidine deaminase RibD-like protein